MSDKLLIGWTTVGREAEAQRLAHDLVDQRLAACVQIDSDVHSVYRWKEEVRSDSEWRLTVKFMAARAEALAAYLKENHPYAVYEWIVVNPQHVSSEYLHWAS